MSDVQGESSTPPETPVIPAPAVAAPAVDQASAKARYVADLAGKPIADEPKVTPTTADAAPAEPVEQVASTDASSPVASETTKAKHNAETRKQELNAEIRALLDHREQLRRETEYLSRAAKPDVKPAVPSPAKPATDADRYLAMPGAPKFEDFDTIEQYSVAASLHVLRAEQHEREQRTHAKQTGDAMKSMQSKGTAAFDDFDQVLRAADQAGLQWPEPIIQLVLTHERGHEIAYLLANKRIADPVQAGMAIAQLLADNREDDEPPALRASVRTTTSATPPPLILGNRPADSGDSELAAIRAGDQGTAKALFIREMAANKSRS